MEDDAADEARSHFRLGVEFFKEENFRAAQVEFQKAYDVKPNYKLLYNIAQACIELREYAQAIAHLEDYLEEGGKSLTRQRQNEVLATIDSLHDRMGMVILVSDEPNAEVSVDGGTRVGRLQGQMKLPLSVGRHSFRADLPGGGNVESFIDLAAGEEQVVHLDFAPAEHQPEPVAAPTSASASPSASPSASASASGSPLPFWLIVGAGVLGIGGTAMGVATSSADREYKLQRLKASNASNIANARSNVVTRARITDGLFIGAVAAAGTAIVLLLTDTGESNPRPESRAALSIGASATGVGLQVHQRF